MNLSLSGIQTAALAGLLLLAANPLPAQPAGDPWSAVGQFQFGQSREPLAAVEEQIRKTEPGGYPALESKMVALLEAPATQKDAKRFLCRWLGIAGSAQCVPALAGLLADPDLSHPARIALEKLPDPAAGRALRDALPKTSGKLQAGIIGSIGIRRDPQAASALRDLTRNADPVVASAAMAALGQIGTDEAVRILASIKVPETPKDLARALVHARLAAAARLAETGDKARAADAFRELMAPGQFQAGRVAALQGLIMALPRAQAVNLVLDLLQGDDAVMRQAAISACLASSDRALKDGVAAQLPSMKSGGRLLLLGALADQPDVAARPPVLAVLQGATDDPTRVAALECLVQHGQDEDVPRLAALAAGNGAVPTAAGKTLARMSNRGIDEALIRLAEGSRAEERAVALDALAKRRAESALPTLVRLVKGTDPVLAAQAAKALGVLGKPDHLPVLAEVLAATGSAELREACQEAVKGICHSSGDLAAGGRVFAAAVAKADSPASKTALLPVLLFTGGEAGLQQVLEASKDANPELRNVGLSALIAWPEAGAGPHLLELAKTTSNPNQAILALREGCLRLGEMEEVPAAQRVNLLRGVFEVAKRTEEKQRALALLSEVPALEALEALQGISPDAALKPDVLKAIVKLARTLGAVHKRQCLAALEQIRAQAGENLRQEVERAIQAVQTAGQSPDGFFLAWLLSGPYEQADKDGTALFDIAFPPETPGGAAQWRPVSAAKDGMLDLGKLLQGDNRVAYLRTMLRCDRETDAVLELGSDDGVKAWLNGRLSHANNAARPCVAGQDKAKVKLKAGLNTLLLKITQSGGDWAACARLVGSDGKPLSVIVAPDEGEK